VFKTGGLADTVNQDNGFIFDNYSKDELIKTIKASIAAYGDKKKWPALVTGAMKLNFSWVESAKKYAELYAKAKKTK
jgi:starch synthase